MKKSHRFILVICILLVVFSGCSKPSTNAASETSKTIVEKKSSFSVCFIDVGQGDSALIECDGKLMAEIKLLEIKYMMFCQIKE